MLKPTSVALSSKKIIDFFVLGLIVRLSLSIFTFNPDMINYWVWAKSMMQQGFGAIYERNFTYLGVMKVNYPPLILVIFVVSYIFSSVFQHFIGLEAYLIFFKLPFIGADLGIAYMYVLYWRRINNKDTTLLYFGLACILFNPTLIYISALWGQIDLLPVLFILIGIYELLFSKHFLYGTLSFIIALLLKQTSIIFIPVLFILVLRNYSYRKLFFPGVITVVVVWFSYLIFALPMKNLFDPIYLYLHSVQFASMTTYTTSYAWNMWALVTDFRTTFDTTPYLLGISYQLWGWGLFSVVSAYIMWAGLTTRKNRELKDELILACRLCLLFSLTAFVFLTRLHERHLLQAIPFLCFLLLGKKNSVIPVILLSVFQFLSLIYVWVPIENVALYQVELLRSFVSIPTLFFLGYYVRILVGFAQNLQVEN